MSIAFRIGRVLLLAVVIAVSLFPFYWMLRTALTPAHQLLTDNTGLWPRHPTLINFRRVIGLTTRTGWRPTSVQALFIDALADIAADIRTQHFE